MVYNSRMDQIRYHQWGTNKDHPNYFSDVETIAQWIAWALEAQQTGWGKNPHQMSTIAVQQHKEKYGSARVYCMLRAPEKVDREWRARLRQWRAEGSQGQRPRKESFERECEIRDMRWYRQVYRSAVSLWPHYMSAIMDDADYPLLVGSIEEAVQALHNGVITKREWDKYRSAMQDDEVCE